MNVIIMIMLLLLLMMMMMMMMMNRTRNDKQFQSYRIESLASIMHKI